MFERHFSHYFPIAVHLLIVQETMCAARRYSAGFPHEYTWVIWVFPCESTPGTVSENYAICYHNTPLTARLTDRPPQTIVTIGNKMRHDFVVFTYAGSYRTSPSTRNFCYCHQGPYISTICRIERFCRLEHSQNRSITADHPSEFENQSLVHQQEHLMHVSGIGLLSLSYSLTSGELPTPRYSWLWIGARLIEVAVALRSLQALSFSHRGRCGANAIVPSRYPWIIKCRRQA